MTLSSRALCSDKIECKLVNLTKNKCEAQHGRSEIAPQASIVSYIVIFSRCNKDIKAKFTRNECIRTSTSHALGNEGKTVVGEGKKKIPETLPTFCLN